MTCDGCKNAVERNVNKIVGIDKVTADVDTNTVTVLAREGEVDFRYVLEQIKKTGKKVNSAKLNDEPQPL
ncbi:heavy-metal-associated domain-containing protein [Piedraia hortae CBS 480.64]|uniref:Heavy-metal-associated domain-containing protein n=1 Tax=Piedraia hortae CBS 480.64 TaxID=1314780 RepID=A0A6A7CA73_9PEZI|nr:heavy-metal-associated domain-containing protein [Piedraia hortae CBS 480.64]